MRLCQVFILVTAHTHCLSVTLHTISSSFDLQNVEEKEEELPVLKSDDVRRDVGGGGGRGVGGGRRGEGGGEGGGGEGGERGGGGGGGERGGEGGRGRGGGGRRGGREGMRRGLSRSGRVEEGEVEGESFDLDQIDAEPTTAHETSGMTSEPTTAHKTSGTTSDPTTAHKTSGMHCVCCFSLLKT